MKKTVRELAKYVEGRLIGSGDTVISDVKSALEAGPQHVTFAVGAFTEHIEEMQAGAILAEAAPENCTKTLIVVDNPRSAFARLVELYHPPMKTQAGIHPTAVVGERVHLGKNVSVMAYAVIDEDAEIGDDTVIYPHTYIGPRVKVGKGCVIFPGAVIHENCILGDRVVLRAHAVIGGQGFGFTTEKNGEHLHIPQIGNVVLGDDVEIGAGSAVDNGTMDSTVVGRGTKIDNLVHLGHNVQIGENCFIIAQTGVAGSTKIGSQCILAGQTGVNGHITIGDHVVLGGKSGVVGSIKEPGAYVGYPARPYSEWGRIEVILSHLPELAKKIRRMEKWMNAGKEKKE